MLISDLNYLEVVDKKDPVYGGDLIVSTAATAGTAIATEGEEFNLSSYASASGDLGSNYQSCSYYGCYRSEYGPSTYAYADTYVYSW